MDWNTFEMTQDPAV